MQGGLGCQRGGVKRSGDHARYLREIVNSHKFNKLTVLVLWTEGEENSKTIRL